MYFSRSPKANNFVGFILDSTEFLERENNVTKDKPVNFVVLVYLVA